MRYIVLILMHLLCVNLHNAREITHEDIKDAMLSLVHMMRENTEKLERHEARERQLGEQLKKTIAVLSKRMSAVDGLKSQLNKLDEKVMGIEQLIAQGDERGRIQMQKTIDTLEDFESRLEGWLTDVENKVSEVNSKPDTTLPPFDDHSLIVAKLNDTQSTLMEKISKAELLLKTETMNLKEATNHQADTTNALLAQTKGINERFNDLEATLENLKGQSESIREKLKEPQFNATSNMDLYKKTLSPLERLLEGTSERIKELPRINEIQLLHAGIQDLLEQVKYVLNDTVTQGINDIEDKLTDNKNETKDTITALRMDLANNAERVNQELNDLEKGQSVMISMADHVLDTKKRVEYGVHQILLEVGDLVKAQGVNINNTLNQRFDGISNDIMDNQNGALANLTTKMEQEMNQVWRQINVMYQQMTESAKALDKLHKQNEDYVNDTTSTMGGMETKVSEITKRMTEVDENLNYLLGRLSLVTQEFNQIKTGLGNALDNIKASFKEVQDKANDLRHPGPHPIPENYKEYDETENNRSENKPLPEIVKHIFNPQIN